MTTDVAKKYFIETMGCQMNVHDSEQLAGLLEAAGYEPAADADDAELVVLNTCSVRERAEEKLFSRLGELRVRAAAAGGRLRVAVTGCVAQQDGASMLRRAPFLDVVAGTHAERRLPALLAEAEEAQRPQVDVALHEDMSFPLGLVRRGDPVRAYVTIIEGCNDACSFCVVPHTRGRERMRPKAEILEEVRDATGAGRKEIHLLGQIVNHYQAPDDASCDLAGLLEAVHEVPGVMRIRFASPHPRHVTLRLIGAIRDLPKVCRHLHLPVQSGSTRVLAAMRRRHTREQYLELVATIRHHVPDIALSTDMIVGFPGESARDFEDTLSLTREVGYHSMFSFAYSVRPNTLASKRLPDDVSEEEKARRLRVLQVLQRDVQTGLHRQAVGTTLEVLVDSVSRRREWEVSGRSSGNTVVNFPGPASLMGQIVGIAVLRAGPNSLWGEISAGVTGRSA